MDDFNTTSLHESKNEWGVRLLTILCPLVIEGFRSIFEESCKLCKDNGEMDKYLMTFQNFIARIPKWNATIVEQERKRIVEKSKCSYLEELVTCVHIIQLKILTAMRDNPQITATEIGQEIQVSSRGVEKSIAKMREKGYLDREGATKKGNWIVLVVWEK